MQQSKKKQADKTIKEKLSLEHLINIKAKSLRELAVRLLSCESALEKHGNVPNNFSVYMNLHRNKKLSDSWNNLSGAQVDNLDAASKEGCLKLEKVFNYVKNILDESENKNLSPRAGACLLLGSYNYKNMQQKDIITFLIIEMLLRDDCCEAIGYLTAKLEHKKRSLNQETKKQQRKIKEDCVYETWVKMINNSEEKKVLLTLPQTKIANHIYSNVFPLLKDKKTEKRKFVLTRTRKTDKDGKIILSGLDIDTIIDIMRKSKTDKFKFNPFKK